MIKFLHIKLLLLFSLSILFGHSALGQTAPTPPTGHYICVETDVTYHAYGTPNSTIEWFLGSTSIGTIDLDDAINNVTYDEGLFQKGDFPYVYASEGNYILSIVETALGCSSSEITIPVHVYLKPVIKEILASEIAACSGDKSTLTVSMQTSLPGALKLQYRLSGEGIDSPSFQDGNVFPNIALAGYTYTVDVRYVVASDNSVVVKGSFVSTTKSVIEEADNEAPVADVTSLPVVKGECGVVSLTAPTATDNCKGAITGTTTDPTSYTAQGTYTVTWTYDDGNGNVSNQTQSIIVDDVTAPVADVTSLSPVTGECGVSSLTAPTATDNCIGAITGTTTDPTSYSAQGTYTVTWTYDDGNGNTSTQKQNVIIDDITAPIAKCKDITVELDANGQASITAEQIDNGSTDNCGIASMSLSKTDFDCDDISTDLVVASTDDHNNYDKYNYSVTINVWPISVVPSSTTCDWGYNYDVELGYDISFSGSKIPNSLSTLQGTLKCDDKSLSFDLPNTGGVGTVMTKGNAWRGTSDCATITPEILGCTDVSIQIEGHGISDQTIPLSLSSPNTVELTVVDNSGNTSTCTANVTVEDNIAPTAICQDIIIQLGADGNATITADQIDNGSNDACGIASVSVSPSTFTTANVGDNTVTLTVTDNNGNVSTCDATVTVEDDLAPTAICQDITIQLDASGNASITAEQIDNGSNDASGILSLVVSKTTFDCSNVGTNEVTLTVTDNNDQVSTCTSIVTVEDLTDPKITAPADVAVNSDLNNCTASSVALGTPTTADNCGVANVTNDAPATFLLGTTTVTWTVTDNSERKATATQVVTVTDNEDPIISDCPENITVGACSNSVNWTEPTATDNCSVTLTSTYNSGDVFPLGTTAVTYTATDGASNTATCSFDVTVEASPTVTAGADVTIGSCGESKTTLNGSGTGNTLTYSWLPTTGLSNANISNPIANPTSTTTYTLAVTDDNGCTATDQITVTVLPVVTISLAETTSITCNGDNAKVTITAGGGDGSYTYSKDGTTYQPSNVFSLPAGDHTLYVKDGNNCVAQGDITITEPDAIKTNLTITTSNICFGDAGIVTIENYESDVTYTLFEGATSLAFTQNDSGTDLILTISASILNTEKKYNITIKAERGGCTLDMDTEVSIIVEHKPTPGPINF